MTLRAWALNDLACMGTTHNASGNKGVLHTLEADCPEAQVDNLCAKRICPEGEIVGITRLVSDPSPEAILPVRCMVRIKKRSCPSGACSESRSDSARQVHAWSQEGAALRVKKRLHSSLDFLSPVEFKQSRAA